MTFTSQILTGLFLGIAAGIFLGELAAPMNTVGEIYIGLLQMTVLPYIVLSLVANLGRISWAESRGLIIAALAVLLGLLAIGMSVLFLVPMAFPAWETATFFSDELVAAPVAIDLVALYVPANPFAALAENVVPSAVLFSILLGVGLSGISGTEGLLRGLDALAEGLNQVNKLIIKLTPLGVFAIASGTAGTISLDEVSRLQAYLITYTVLVAILTVVVLPMIVGALTPFRFRDVLGVPKDTLIMIFATGKIIVLMPQLIDNLKSLFARYDRLDEETEQNASVLLPLAYPFPNLGTYVILMFIPFAAWYIGRGLDLGELLVLQGASLLSAFVAPIIGIPFLLDLLRLPSDLIDLFTVSTVYTDRIRVVLGGMHLFALGILVLSIRQGSFRVDWQRLGTAIAIGIAAVLLSLLAIRSYLGYAYGDSYTGDRALIEMRWMDRTVPVTQYRENPPPVFQGEVDRLARIADRGTVRVGYLPDALPFAFTNANSEVVGFDIELAHDLATDLGVGLELVRLEVDVIDDYFANGRVDIVMSGLAMTPDRLRRWRFGGSPIDLNLGFLVPDHARRDFADLINLQRRSELRLGVVQFDPAFERRLTLLLPNATIEAIPSPRPFLRGERPELDAVVYSAEGGSAWTLIYPEYSVIVPQPNTIQLPAGYPVPVDDERWARYVEQWVLLKQKDGTVNALFDHWIRGRGAESTEPRWSVVRNVLGWVD
ncbi:MAG: cation:dicarboxylase symporter family transporter [Pseudomonadota bacterium]